MCGEKTDLEPEDILRIGSPPRVRGKEVLWRPQPKQAGITPACAGKRSTPAARAIWMQDHPRVCGEK